MNYKLIYDKIIERAKNEDRVKGDGCYYEKHHIIPKCVNGSNDKSNLVLLTGREHFICHKLLYKSSPDNDSLFKSYHAMSKMKNKYQLGRYCYVISSREYSIIREKYSEISRKRMIENNPMRNPLVARKVSKWLSKHNRGENNSFYGMGYTMIGEKNHFYGKHHTNETKKSISKKNKQHYIDNPNRLIKSEDHKNKVNEKNKTRYYIRTIKKFATSDENIQKLSFFYKVTVDTILSRLNDDPFDKEPTIDQMINDKRRYKLQRVKYNELCRCLGLDNEIINV